MAENRLTSAVADSGKLQFSVDAALFRELGERLVGRPEIALGELVKNAYDADATDVVIRMTDDEIQVIDNGHGMSFDEFKRFWMRVGSPHKEAQRQSRKFGRPLTGSKGIGRLAVQFLGSRIDLRTTPTSATARELSATVDWSRAVRAKTMTSAAALYRRRARTADFTNKSKHGTAITVSGLNQTWDEESITGLAQEIWWLEPPFGRTRSKTEDYFAVELETADEAAARAFDRQMSASLDIWEARLLGKITRTKFRVRGGGPPRRVVDLVLEFRSGRRDQIKYEWPPPHRTDWGWDGCHIDSLDFEIRIYNLIHRQPRGIRVNTARAYFNRFGGVHVYDGGFRLPYYGPESDWLGIEMTHSHRITRSQLLPEGLRAANGLSYLPTNSRIFGSAQINTSHERRAAQTWKRERQQHLQIQVSRDRLVDNRALADLSGIVRWAIDYYANREAAARAADLDSIRPTDSERLEDVLKRVKDKIDPSVAKELRVAARERDRAVERDRDRLMREAGLLGALATAGVSALAYEHEAARQLDELEELARRITASSSAREQARLGAELQTWVESSRRTRALFAPLLSGAPRDTSKRLLVRPLVEEVAETVLPIAPDVDFRLDRLDGRLRLPRGTEAEWHALFQNVLFNAVDAMLDTDRKVVRIGSYANGANRAVYVDDTGVGIDLATAEQLFEPFERALEVTPDKRGLQIGGSGLGLTIVRMIARSVGVNITFLPPPGPYKTRFRISWRDDA
jgi:signal transduction histidine kinase